MEQRQEANTAHCSSNRSVRERSWQWEIADGSEGILQLHYGNTYCIWSACMMVFWKVCTQCPKNCHRKLVSHTHTHTHTLVKEESRVPANTYRIFSNLIRTSFCWLLKRKKKLVRGSNPHLSFNRPLRAAPSEVARWVSAVWKAIPESIIVRSFKKCCISNALDGSEDDILWEDDGEVKDDSDWVTDNDSVMSDDGESDE